MEKSELLKCRDRIENIRQKMNWDIKKIHKILKEKFDTVPNEYNAFFKQYKYDGKKYKGSVKHFCTYYEYIYNLKEVQEKLTTPSKQNIFQYIVGILIGILLGLIVWNILFPNDELI
ncbi:hypothetical protein JCM11957_03380 [Caminibacter profundus]